MYLVFIRDHNCKNRETNTSCKKAIDSFFIYSFWTLSAYQQAMLTQRPNARTLKSIKNKHQAQASSTNTKAPKITISGIFCVFLMILCCFIVFVWRHTHDTVAEMKKDSMIKQNVHGQKQQMDEKKKMIDGDDMICHQILKHYQSDRNNISFN